MDERWALVDRRGDDGELYGSFELLPCGPRSDSWLRPDRLRFRTQRTARRYSLLAVAAAMAWGVVDVSSAERGYRDVSESEIDALWASIGGR